MNSAASVAGDARACEHADGLLACSLACRKTDQLKTLLEFMASCEPVHRQSAAACVSAYLQSLEEDGLDDDIRRALDELENLPPEAFPDLRTDVNTRYSAADSDSSGSAAQSQ